MTDTYQAVYDATRSKISGCDTQGAIESALREAFGLASHHLACVSQEWQSAAWETCRPSVLYRPAISIDGNKWCALYGDNLQDGVAGFGDSPAEAMQAFDKAWAAKLEAKP